jgi:exonuclease SbcC
MRKIAEIVIKGFQAHENSTVRPSPFLTVVTGPNDAGKTAFQMAVRWVAYGEPEGDSFILDIVDKTTKQSIRRSDSAFVRIVMNDGAYVEKTRKRSGKTEYVVFRPEWEASRRYMKADVPEEVTEILGIQKVTLADTDTDINFSYQHDPYFMLSEAPSYGAKILGKMADTEDIDKAIKATSQDIYEERQAMSTASKIVEMKTAELAAYEGLDEQKEQLDAAEVIFKQAEVNMERGRRLRGMFSGWEDTTNTVAAKAVKLDYLSRVNGLADRLTEIEKLQSRRARLEELCQSYRDNEVRILNLGAVIQNIGDVSAMADAVRIIEGNVARAAVFRGIETGYSNASSAYIKAVTVIQETAFIGKVTADIEVIEAIIQRYNRLFMLNVRYHNQQEVINRNTDILNRLPDTGALLSSIKDIESKERRWRILVELRFGMNTRQDHIKSAGDALRISNIAYQGAKEEEVKAWEASGGICPLCNKPLEQGVCNNVNL